MLKHIGKEIVRLLKACLFLKRNIANNSKSINNDKNYFAYPDVF